MESVSKETWSNNGKASDSNKKYESVLKSASDTDSRTVVVLIYKWSAAVVDIITDETAHTTRPAVSRPRRHVAAKLLFYGLRASPTNRIHRALVPNPGLGS